MRSSTRFQRCRRVLALLCLPMLGELTGATPALELNAFTLEKPGLHPGKIALSVKIGRLEGRLDRVEAEGRYLLDYHAENVEPLISFIEPRVLGDTKELPRIALALVREARRTGLDPRLLGGVLLVENPWLDPTVRSPVGAIGLMQVMPFHAGGWGCPRDDLTHVETNICHGTRILAEALRRTEGDLDAALLRYNGCKHGTNTPDCHRYPDRVYQHLAWDDGPNPFEVVAAR